MQCQSLLIDFLIILFTFWSSFFFLFLILSHPVTSYVLVELLPCLLWYWLKHASNLLRKYMIFFIVDKHELDFMREMYKKSSCVENDSWETDLLFVLFLVEIKDEYNIRIYFSLKVTDSVKGFYQRRICGVTFKKKGEERQL